MRKVLTIGTILLILIIGLVKINKEFNKLETNIVKLDSELDNMSNINDVLRANIGSLEEDYSELKLEHDKVVKELEQSTKDQSELKKVNQQLRNSNKDLEKKVKTPTRGKDIGKSKIKSSNNKKSTTKVVSDGKSLGTFQTTAYCNCSICCGKWAGGKTASGTTPRAGRTIAVDPNVIPMGTKVIINGNEYTAEDTGSAVKGKIIDLYMSDHQSALSYGRRNVEVKIK